MTARALVVPAVGGTIGLLGAAAGYPLGWVVLAMSAALLVAEWQAARRGL